MAAPRTEDWEDVKPINAFTARNTAMINLNTGKIVQLYSANTKIVVVQKYVSPNGTYYRTQSAEHHNLNWAFEASALGLPDEKAPPAPSIILGKKDRPTNNSVKKQKVNQKAGSPKGGEEKRCTSWFKKLFGRKNG